MKKEGCQIGFSETSFAKKPVNLVRTVNLFARETFKAALPRGAVDALRKARRIARAPLPEGETRWTAALRILREP